MFLFFMSGEKNISILVLVLFFYFQGGVFNVFMCFFACLFSEVEGSQCKGASSFK